jgi:hypothetical protein
MRNPDAGADDYASPYPDGLPGHGWRDTEVRAAFAALVRAADATRRVFQFLRDRGELGATDFEGMDALGMFSFPKRRSDLAHLSPPIVVDSGKRRPSPRGKLAIVWTLNPAIAPGPLWSGRKGDA